jgi:cytochrome P450
MESKNKKYNIPIGYSLLETAFNSNEFIRSPVKFISKSMEKFSGTYSAKLGKNKKFILTKNPDFISYVLKENHKNYAKSELSTKNASKLFGKGLLFSNGEYWLRQRRLIQPAFHKEKILGFYDIVIKTIEDFLSKFPIGKNIDMYPLMHQLAFNIVIKSVFDINLSAQAMEELSNDFSELQEFLIKDINQPFRKLLYPITRIDKKNYSKAKRLRENFIKIIEQRKSSKENFSDLLHMLLNSKYEDTGENMSTDQIVDEVLIIIFAGHETTANTISWLLYLLANNTLVLQKLNSSIATHSVYESLNNEYIKATINEAMRMYPAAWMTERVAIEDDQFGDYHYPKGTIIIPYFFGLHRDKGIWKDELNFDPERFIRDTKISKSKNYFPFGAGPRMCIGNNFAMAEMSFFIYIFLKKFQIQATVQIPEMKALITLRPDKVILEVNRIIC